MSGELLNGGAGTGNWSTPANWSSAAKPVSDDDAIIPPDLPYNVSMSADETGVDLDLFHVHRDYAKTVGTSASPIQIATDFLEVYGSSGFYMESADDGGAGLITDNAWIQMPNANTPVELGTKAGSTAGEWKFINIDRGLVTCKANILFNAGSQIVVNSAAASLILTPGADSLALLYLNAGTVQSDSPISVAHIAGGQLTQDTAICQTAYVHSGARYVMNNDQASAIHVYGGGTLDLLNNSIKKTITNLYLHPGANILWDPGASPGGPGGLHTVSTIFADFRGWGF